MTGRKKANVYILILLAIDIKTMKKLFPYIEGTESKSAFLILPIHAF